MSQVQIFDNGGSPFPQIEFVQGTSGGAVGPNPGTFITDFSSSFISNDLAINGYPSIYDVDFVNITKYTPYVVDNAASINVLNFSANFVAGNSIVPTVDSVPLAAVLFSVNNATTIANVATRIATAGGVLSAIVTGTHQITVQFYAGAHVVNSVVTTGGVSQPTVVINASVNAPFGTIQSAVNAAHAAGGGLVAIKWSLQPYIENLTLYNSITLMGVSPIGNANKVSIEGLHTPPTSGELCFANLDLLDTSAIISSIAAGTTNIYFQNCTLSITNGFVANLASWTGSINFINCDSLSLDDGIVNNATGTAIINIIDSELGGGGQVFTTRGFVNARNSIIDAKSNFLASAIINYQDTYTQATTFNTLASATFNGAQISGASVPAITQNSSGSISLINVSIDSNNNPAIAGAGGGVISLAGVPFLNNTVIAGTLTTNVFDWKPYATQGTSVTATVGTASFDQNFFTVTNGFVSASPSQIFAITFLTDADSPYTLLSTDYYLSCDVTSGPLTILMNNTDFSGRTTVIKDSTGNSQTNNITITTPGGIVTIDGQTTFLIDTPYEAFDIIFNGTFYEIF
ncbi:MAG: hypothetical protein EPO02_13210 [Nitrospirae bacterium]|nr:MAG: hypothetical protein EPO02_13210 [Nitrospirota bacterium]